MEPYLIIAFELAVLYFIFWYMFLRESKRPEIKRGLWGQYPGLNKQSPTAKELEKETLSR